MCAEGFVWRKWVQRHAEWSIMGMWMCIHNACMGWFQYALHLQTSFVIHWMRQGSTHTHYYKGNIWINRLWCCQRMRYGSEILLTIRRNNEAELCRNHPTIHEHTQHTGLHFIGSGLDIIKTCLQVKGKVRIRNQHHIRLFAVTMLCYATIRLSQKPFKIEFFVKYVTFVAKSSSDATTAWQSNASAREHNYSISSI